ncbi:MAG: sialate O-acetylesterase [Pseudoxanthomonas sp.]
MKRIASIAAGCLLALALPAAAAELPLVFSDGMVVQRGKPIPVWGRSAPGAEVRVAFAGNTAKATADAHGDWRVNLPAHAAGGPFELRVDDGTAPLTLHDVLVGEVWLASGQSNMEWPLLSTDGAQAAIDAANDPLVRHFKIPKSWAGTPQWQLQGGQWLAASPQTAGQFSAVAYYFALELRKATGVAVGIIDSSWGGSSIEAWMDAAMLGLDTDALAKKMQQRRAMEERTAAAVLARTEAWPKVDAASEALAAPAVDDADWARVQVPAAWETQGFAGMDGVAWYRTRFALTAAEAAAGVTLGLGQIDDSDVAWVNGQRVGSYTNGWNVPRVYQVPAAALHAGDNVLAVRVQDDGSGGGIVGAPDQVYVQPGGGGRRSLAGEWRFRTAQVRVSLADDKNQVDTLLYNAMIHPLEPYPLAGVIWYQGESNAYDPGALKYRDQFKGMIEGWRARWNAPKLPFLWVQLASFGATQDYGRSDWSVLRESQSAALALPATAQAVTIDIGNPGDIHPRNKRDVGHRLALAARHVAYGETLDYHGPVPAGFRFGSGQVAIPFDIGSAALAVRGGGEGIAGFSVAGADRVFHPATARIEGATVLVRSDAVAAPVAVRYAWRDAPVDADLINSAGLPASPFRSDDW